MACRTLYLSKKQRNKGKYHYTCPQSHLGHKTEFRDPRRSRNLLCSRHTQINRTGSEDFMDNGSNRWQCNSLQTTLQQQIRPRAPDCHWPAAVFTTKWLNSAGVASRQIVQQNGDPTQKLTAVGSSYSSEQNWKKGCFWEGKMPEGSYQIKYSLTVIQTWSVKGVIVYLHMYTTWSSVLAHILFHPKCCVYLPCGHRSFAVPTTSH